MNDLVFARINQIIYETRNHSKTANHFYNLRNRLLFGQKLTKKMKQNLGWIKKEVEKDELLYRK